MKIAFLGLGRMGTELVSHLIDEGHDVTVWNRTAEAAVAIAEKGARVADTSADAVADAEVVITTLFGPDTVREVILNGDLPFRAEATWIDITTVSPDDTVEFAAWSAGRSIQYAHSPVIGSLAPAKARALGVLLGGNAAATAVAAPLVSLWADPDRFHIYDEPGKAATGKLVANLALAVAMQGVVEALRLGHGGGMTTDEVFDQLLEKTMLAPIATMKGGVIRGGSFDDTQFSANALAKDTGLMLSTADGPLPALAAAAASLAIAIDAGHGEDDLSVIVQPDS